MGRKLHYRPGSFYRVDDWSGFPTRAERTKKQWDGLIVDERHWEARQPQDLVRGVRDDQSVPDARPLAPNSYVGPLYLQLTQDAAALATTVVVNEVQGLSVGAAIGVMNEEGTLFNTTCVALDIAALTITLEAPLPLPAPAGNAVVVYPALPISGNASFIWDESEWDDGQDWS